MPSPKKRAPPEGRMVQENLFGGAMVAAPSQAARPMARAPVEAEWDAAAMVRARLARQNALGAHMHAKNEAVDAFRAATERAAESGIAPHYDPRVIRASELVAETAVAVRAAAAAHEAAWGGRELYTLPAATQAEIERMTRQARFQELGGAKPNRAHHGSGSAAFGVIRGRRGTFDHGGAQVHGTFHPGVTVVDPHHFRQIDRGDAIVSDDPRHPFVWVRYGRGLEGHVYRYSTYRRQGPTWHRTATGDALAVEEPKRNVRHRRRR